MTPTPTTNSQLRLRLADFRTLPEALDYAAKGRTGFNFFTAKGELAVAVSYAELRDRALIAAKGLIAAKVPLHARVVLLGDTDPDIFAMFFACQYAGLIPVTVPIPASLGGRDAYVASLKRLLTSAGATVAIAPPDYVGFLRQATDSMDPKPALIGTPADVYALPGRDAALRPFGPDDPCYHQYSSGSTRWPKGVDVPQRCLMANGHGIANAGLCVAAGDRCVSWLPFYHDMGLVGFMLVPALCQLTTDFLATRDFARRSLTWLKLIGDHGGTLSYSPSFGYDLCCRRAENSTASFDLKTWRAAGIGGDMIQPAVLGRFAETFAEHGFDPRAFVPSYGMAETTLAISFAPLGRGVEVDLIDRRSLSEEQLAAAGGDATSRAFVRCGEPLPNHAVEIRAEDGSVLPERHIGRIFVRGPSIALGYVDDPDATADAFKDDGWLDTGDLGFKVDSSVTVTGRSKDLIIINGRNIWPQDLEWAVEGIDGLRRGDVAAFSIEDGASGPRVVVLIQCRRSGQEQRESLMRDAKTVLQREAAVDAQIVLIPPHGLPVTSSGKLSRARARSNYLGGAYEADADPSPLRAAAGGD